MNKQEEEELIRQLGYLMRFANRINNNHPELVSDTIRVAIERSKEIIKNNIKIV